MLQRPPTAALAEVRGQCRGASGSGTPGLRHPSGRERARASGTSRKAVAFAIRGSGKRRGCRAAGDCGTGFNDSASIRHHCTVRSREVVTIIEILSPWNKIGDGRSQYRQQQAEILVSDTHLVEIDLLRRGQHTVALPEALAPPSDYRICFHRAHAERFGYLPLSVRDPLPNIPIPLRAPDTDVVLHLQEVFNGNYDGGAFAYKVNYHQPPNPPLPPEDAEWARGLIARRP